MGSMNEFYTREPANAGKRVMLSRPDGTPTDSWLNVRSRWSDEFRAAQDKALQEAAKASESEREEAIKRLKLDVLASLVASWSFEQPCNAANVREFLENAPQIAERVDKIAGDDVRFFGNGLSDSTLGPSPNSSSGKSPKGRKSR